MKFALTEKTIQAELLRSQLLSNERCGAFNSFEGWVRCHNDGKRVNYLVYTAYEELALKQGQAILEKAKELFAIEDAVCVHRIGHLEIGDMAVWVGVNAGHRDASFQACRYIIDELKANVPIWKQEFYLDYQEAAWLANPEALS